MKTITLLIKVDIDDNADETDYDHKALVDEIESGVNVAVEDVTGYEPTDISVEIIGVMQ